MDYNEIRITNKVYNIASGTKEVCEVEAITRLGIQYNSETRQGTCSMGNLEPILLNDEWLLNLGFEKIPNQMYINGFKYFLHTEGLNYENYHKDGTYFDGIGTIQNNGNLVVNTLCRGNYVCNSVQYVHELQNLYYSLTEKELVCKKV